MLEEVETLELRLMVMMLLYWPEIKAFSFRFDLGSNLRRKPLSGSKGAREVTVNPIYRT